MNHIRKKISSDQPEVNCRTADDASQDWVCLKCNNLNFSFRSKCNRCKVQSREDNQQLLYADYYYYNQYYSYQQPQQTQPFTLSDNYVPQSGATILPQKKSYMSQSQLSIAEDDHLPSVSPLIKRYRAGKQKGNRKGKSSIFGWKLYDTQSWSEQELPIINIADVIQDLSLTDDQEASQQFAKSVQK